MTANAPLRRTPVLTIYREYAAEDFDRGHVVSSLKRFLRHPNTTQAARDEAMSVAELPEVLK